MKFRFEYRTCDNVLHSDVVAAKSREAVFALLAKRGIKPGRVEPLPDPYRRLRLSVAVGIVLCVVSWIGWCVYLHSITVHPETRKQIYGDPVLIEKAVASDWVDVLPDPVDRYLARYAQPGWRVRFPFDSEVRRCVLVGLAANVEKRICYAGSDLMEYRQLKRIVAGIRLEAAEFLSAGGNVEKFLELLDVRQAREIEIRTKLEAEFIEACSHLATNRLFDAWVDCNRKLKAKGLKMIELPASVAEP